MKKIFFVVSDYNETRLDKWLKKNFKHLTQSFIEKHLRKGNIKINNKKVKSKYKLSENDKVILFNYSEKIYEKNIEKNIEKKIEKNLNIKNTKLFKSSIVFENNDFMIINKWNGISTQGGSKINISIDDIIKNISLKYNLVHRLDKETSGILIIAKNLIYTKIFGKLFKDNKITKLYLAICEGKPKLSASEVNLDILNKENKKSKSITKYKVLQTKNNLSNIVFNPLTGKTHQIRIVSKHLGSPIVGDKKYNNNSNLSVEKLKLHSYLLKFIIKDKEYVFYSNVPDHYKKILEKNDMKNFSNRIIQNYLKFFNS